MTRFSTFEAASKHEQGCPHRSTLPASPSPAPTASAEATGDNLATLHAEVVALRKANVEVRARAERAELQLRHRGGSDSTGRGSRRGRRDGQSPQQSEAAEAWEADAHSVVRNQERLERAQREVARLSNAIVAAQAEAAEERHRPPCKQKLLMKAEGTCRQAWHLQQPQFMAIQWSLWMARRAWVQAADALPTQWLQGV